MPLRLVSHKLPPHTIPPRDLLFPRLVTLANDRGSPASPLDSCSMKDRFTYWVIFIYWACLGRRSRTSPEPDSLTLKQFQRTYALNPRTEDAQAGETKG
jgi:hypothetical protein|uniref:Uncharacterized protein n=2 Tax=Picea TaxID=3328 RepID=A0A101LWU7_PICGL|nr:hypothetical protein ABT39_MTgene6264 [Picea glauca]QHR92647.1 hypothetical protein Q903MT_gene6695 [Picea sitchensis]